MPTRHWRVTLARNSGLTLREAEPKMTLQRIGQGSGSNSGVECQLPKLDVAGSNPVSRSRHQTLAFEDLHSQ